MRRDPYAYMYYGLTRIMEYACIDVLWINLDYGSLSQRKISLSLMKLILDIFLS